MRVGPGLICIHIGIHIHSKWPDEWMDERIEGIGDATYVRIRCVLCVIYRTGMYMDLSCLSCMSVVGSQ